MSNKTVENKVKANAIKLEKVIDDLNIPIGKHVAYDGIKSYFADTFADAVKIGEKVFGENSGFVVRKVGPVPILSHLIKK